MTTPPGQEPRPGPTRGGSARPAPRGADPGWTGGGDARRGGSGRGAGAPGSPGAPGARPRDGADPRRDGYGSAAAGRTGRPEPDPRTRRRGDLGPGAPGAGGTRADRGWGTQRGAGSASRDAGAPRRNQPGGRDDFRATQRVPGRAPVPPGAPQGLRAAPAFRWLGALATRTAAYILLAGTVLGIIGTVVTGGEPGFLLGFFVTVGSIIAALGIRRRRVHVVLPLPALLLFFGAVVTGAVHDRAVDTSTTEYGVNFLQWIANVFFAMCVSTILMLVIIGARWALSRQLVSGQFPMSGGAASADRGPSPRPRPDGTRPGRDRRPGDPWTSRDDARGTPPDRDRWGSERRDGSDRWDPRSWGGDRTQRANRPSWTPKDQPDSRTPRNDRPRPTS